MRGQVLSIFNLVSKLSPNFILDVIYQSSRILSIFTKKDVKFFLGDRDIQIFIYYKAVFLLYPARADIISIKKGDKEGTIVSVSSSNVEMIFVLVPEQIAIQKRFSKI